MSRKLGESQIRYSCGEAKNLSTLRKRRIIAHVCTPLSRHYTRNVLVPNWRLRVGLPGSKLTGLYRNPSKNQQQPHSSHSAVRTGQCTLHDSRTTAAYRCTCALLTYCCAVCVFVCSCCKAQAYGTLSAWSYDLDPCNYELPVRLLSSPQRTVRRRIAPSRTSHRPHTTLSHGISDKDPVITTGTDIISCTSEKQCFQHSDPLPRHFQRFAGPSKEAFGHVD